MYFQLRREQVGAIRGKRHAKALADTFAGTKTAAKVDPATGDVVATPPSGHATRYSFDGQGFVSRITAPMGREWNLTSDSSGRATSVRNPAGSVASFAYDARGRVSQMDRDGRPIVQLQHDSTGNLIRTRFADGTNEFLAFEREKLLTAASRRSGITQHFEWDNQECLTAIVDGKGNRTRYEYGRFTKPDRAIFADGTTERYQYDESGLLKEFSQSGGSAASLKFAERRIESAKYADGLELRYKYDDEGRLTAAAAGKAETRWTYSGDRLVSEQSPNGAAEYLHDEAGHPTGLVYPSGASVGFSWDADGRLASIRDWSGAETAWHYADPDRGWEVSYPGGVVAQTRLLPTGLTESIQVRNSQTALWRFGVQYDEEDRIASRHDSLSGQHDFGYDADGRLTRAGDERFSYDAADNLSKDGSPDGNVSFDQRGNRLEGGARGGTWRFEWDARNRLTGAIGPRGEKIRYGYDALDRGIFRLQDGRSTEYQWAGETLISEVERDASGQVLRQQEYLFIPGTQTLFALRVDGAMFYAHCDTLGTPRLLTSATGASVWAATYDAWGAPAQTWGDHIRQPWRFPGQYADEATGLHYNRFRVYSPFEGRYLSRDPLGYVGGLNLYAYAGNDPVNSADPSGLWGWKGILTAVAAVAVGVAVTAAIIVTAPVSVPALLVTGAAIVAGGAAAGAVGFGLNQALNEDQFCATCIAKEALKGLGVGALSALPFAFLPATAGVAAFAAVGALSGGIGYAGSVFTHPGTAWNWGDFAGSVGIGAATAGLGRFIGPKISGLFRSEPEKPPSVPKDVSPSASPGKPEWLKRLDKGNAFDDAQAQKYPNNEVYIDRPDGKGYYRLDSYDPANGEIVSRKFTQFGDIQESTGVSYVNELANKYPPGSTIADVPSSGPLAGQKLQGQMILEVPPQNAPIPQSVIDAADSGNIIIRDSAGKIYNP